MADIDTTKDTVVPVAAVTPTPPTTPEVPVVKSSGITAQGEPNGLPPAAPEVQLQAPEEVIKLREWFHENIHDSIHSQDTPHFNALHQLVENVCAKLHSKYPLAKDDLNPLTKDA